MHRDSPSNPTMRPVSGGKSLVTFCTYKERQDALRNTIIMDDVGSVDVQRTTEENAIQENGNLIVPPSPPLQFADRKPQSFEPIDMIGNSPQRSTAQSNRMSSRAEFKKPPDSPTPDYDNVHERGTIPKTQHTKPLNGNVAGGSGFVSNRRTMRLGTVTIGEYEGNQQQRKEPGKFDFLSQKGAHTDDRTERDGLSLQTELRNTLSRSNLKKTTSPINTIVPMEHQSHCMQHNSFGGQHVPSTTGDNEKEYTNVEKLTRLLQCKQNQNQSEVYGRPSSYTTGRKTTTNQGAEGVQMRHDQPGTGILKNGGSSRSSRSSLSRNSEKSISFGN